MRIRSTRPEFYRSNTIAQLEWADRFVLKGLESYVDDNGVGKDDLELIAGDVFPRDLSRAPDTLARLSEAITRIAALGLIVRYVFDGEHLIYVDKWKDIQRIDKPGKGRFPRPDGSLEYLEPVDRASYRKPRETVAPVTEEQGNRGTEEDDDTRDANPRESVATPKQVVVVKPPSAEELAESLVSEILAGAGYPQATLRRLIGQVRKLLEQNHSLELVAAAVTEWDRRPNCNRPEFLPTVLSDVIKAGRSTEVGATGTAKITGAEKQRRAACTDCDERGMAENDDGSAYRCDHRSLDRARA